MQVSEKINKITKELSKFSKIKAVYLFGSAVNGNMHKHSDIDICMIGEKEENLIGLIDSEKVFDIVSFWDMPLAIRFRVFKEGKALFIKDKMYIDRVKINTLKEYLDFKPLINRYCWERFRCMI